MNIRLALLLPVCLFALSAAFADPPPVPTAVPLETLQRALAEATTAKDWAGALVLAERVNEAVEQQHVETLYTIARLQALLGHKKEAYEWLERANDTGLMNVWDVRKDEAFSGIRDEDEFKKLTRAIWLKAYIHLLERKERDAYQKPEQVMQALAFRPGERVADVGAGSGYFTVRVARAVGPSGVVWAVDIAQELLDYLGRRAKEEALSNIRLVKVAPDDPQLPQAGVDTILMVDTLHYIKNRAAYAAKLRAALAQGGRVVVIDFIPKAPGERAWGPPPEQNMSREEVDVAMAAAGLKPARVYDFLPEHFFVEYTVKRHE
jgi:ubiquinone/menaquinone biosynthesis C-methylase UbiE